MTLPLFDVPQLPRLVALMLMSGTTKAHNESVNIWIVPGKQDLSVRVTPEVKAEFEQLRQGIADSEIYAAYKQRRKWQETE